MLVAFTPRPQRERCHSERCEALCTPPSCFRKGLALAWNRTRNGLGAGAAVVDPTPCTFRRKRGTDRHHLPGRHPEPCLPHGVAWPDPKAPGARRSVRRSPARRRPQYLPQTGVKQGRPWAQHHRTRRRAGGNGSDGPSCPGHLPADQQGSPGYERGARRAPREPSGESSPRAGYRSVGHRAKH